MFDEKQCRICLDTTEPEEMIYPCRCCGTQKYVHRNCLQAWRNSGINDGYFRCTVCHYRYKVSRVWWARLLESKVLVGGLTLSAMALGGYTLGYGSAVAYNRYWFYMRNYEYYSPPRMQVIFHAFCWVGIPGIISGIIDSLCRARPARGNNNNTGNTYNTYNTYNQPVIPTPRHTRRAYDVKKDKDDKKRKTTAAHYEEKSTIVWIALAAGVGYGFYRTYSWVQKKSVMVCANIRSFVENVE